MEIVTLLVIFLVVELRMVRGEPEDNEEMGCDNTKLPTLRNYLFLGVKLQFYPQQHY